VLVTGVAGFIGSFVARNLLHLGMHVVGMDSLNAYYDPGLKRARVDRLATDARLRFEHVDLADMSMLQDAFRAHAPRRVVQMAAQAGVHHSLSRPEDYVRNNLVATANLLECCRHGDVEHLIFASSSSVYGLSRALPLSTRVPADHPAQFYAATKRSTELMAHAYSNLMGMPSTGLRFFSAYGPITDISANHVEVASVGGLLRIERREVVADTGSIRLRVGDRFVMPSSCLEHAMASRVVFGLSGMRVVVPAVEKSSGWGKHAAP